MKFLTNISIAAISLLLVSGCAVIPKQLDSLGQDNGEVFLRNADVPETFLSHLSAVEQSASAQALETTQTKLRSNFSEQIITRGDLLRMRIHGMSNFDGMYQVNVAGELEVPFSHSLVISGLTRLQAVTKIEQELVDKEWFDSELVHVDISIVELAPVNVSVTGAVFVPGQISINNKPATKTRDNIPQLGGAFSSARDLTAALMAAGGIRPDADLNRIFIMRGEQIIQLSLADIVLGNQFVKTPALINGDHILVGSSGIENAGYIKPSPITPPGMRVFMSNLIAPSLSNAQGAVGADSTRLPYGSSLIDSAISANCIGGTHQANASRSVILITRNHGSKQQIVVRRSINQLLANSSNHAVNPFVMPNDAVACYDSRFTNFRDVARGIGEVISPLILGRLL